MVEPEKKGFRKKKRKILKKKINCFYLGNSAYLEDTVRNLREENAKLIQLLRSRKYNHFLNNNYFIYFFVQKVLYLIHRLQQ